jgi:DNA-binding NarL/FixJ family response regulator
MKSVLIKDFDMTEKELQSIPLVGAGSQVIPEIEPGSALLVRRENGKIDLLFIDYIMPGLDSASCMKVLRELRPGVPVLTVLKEKERIAHIHRL